MDAQSSVSASAGVLDDNHYELNAYGEIDYSRPITNAKFDEYTRDNTSVVDKTSELEPSQVIPVFATESVSDSIADNTSTHNDRFGNNVARLGRLNAFAIVCDSFVGHVALFRTTTGVCMALNLTLHVKLAEMLDVIEVCT